MLLHCAQLCRADERVAVFIREERRHLNLEFDLIHHVGKWIVVDALEDTNTIRRNATLLAKTKYVNPCTRSNRCEKRCERGWGAGSRRLVCGYSKAAKMRIHA